MVWAARRVGRPVKWTGDRTEAFLTDYNARDVVTKARLGFDKRGPHPGDGPGADRQYRRAHGFLRAAQQRLSCGADGLRRAGRVGAAAAPHDQHGADRAVPRRRPAGGDRRDGADARHRGTPPQDRPGRTAPPQSHPARQAAAPHRHRAHLRQRGIRREPRARARCCRLGGILQARRAEAKKRGRLLGIGVANYVETPVGMPHERVKVERLARRRRPHRRNAIERTGPRDQLPAGDGGPAWRGAGSDQLRQRRQRDARLRRRDAFRSLDAACRLADGRDLAARSSARRAGSPSAPARRARRRHRVHRRSVHRAEQQSPAQPVRHRARRSARTPNLPDELRAPLGAEATFTGRIPAYPTGAAVCEVEVDPGHRHGRRPPLHLDRRRRPGDQPAHPARPGAWRRRARHGPGDAGGAGLGAGLGPDAVGEFSRLCDAARGSLSRTWMSS